MLALSIGAMRPKAGASSTHSKRFARQRTWTPYEPGAQLAKRPPGTRPPWRQPHPAARIAPQRVLPNPARPEQPCHSLPLAGGVAAHLRLRRLVRCRTRADCAGRRVAQPRHHQIHERIPAFALLRAGLPPQPARGRGSAVGPSRIGHRASAVGFRPPIAPARRHPHPSDRQRRGRQYRAPHSRLRARGLAEMAAARGASSGRDARHADPARTARLV